MRQPEVPPGAWVTIHYTVTHNPAGGEDLERRTAAIHRQQARSATTRPRRSCLHEQPGSSSMGPGRGSAGNLAYDRDRLIEKRLVERQLAYLLISMRQALLSLPVKIADHFGDREAAMREVVQYAERALLDCYSSGGKLWDFPRFCGNQKSMLAVAQPKSL